MTAPLRLQASRATWVWAGVAAVLAFVGWYKTINLLLLLGYAMLAAAVVNALAARRAAQRVRAEVREVPVALPDELISVSVEIANETEKAASVRIACGEAATSPGWLFAPLEAHSRHTVTAELQFPARGCYPFGPLIADSGHPFGLVQARTEVAAAQLIRVLPRAGRIDEEMFRRWLIRGGAADGTGHTLARQAALGSGDVRGLRPYRPGDSPREVHWRSSARRGQLLVREYDRTEPLNLFLVVDPFRAADEPPGSAALEWCLSLALTLGLTWAAADHPADVTLVVPTQAGPVSATGRATPGFIRRAFAVLAEVVGQPDVPVTGPIGLRAERAARLLISPRPNSPLLAPFLAAGRPLRNVTYPVGVPWFTPPATIPKRGRS